MKTLKQLHEIKSVSKLRSKLIKVDHMINEQRHHELVLEAFDKDKMKLANDLIHKLNSINFGALKTLSNAKNLAIKDCKESLSGGGGFVQKIVNLFKKGNTNPLADTVALCDALFNFFSIFPETVKALNANNKVKSGGIEFNSDSTLGSLFDDEKEDEFDAFANAVKNKEPKALTLQKVIMTGFKPDKLLTSIGKNYFSKYLNGKSGMRSLTSEMLGMKISELLSIAENVTSALKNAEIVGQAVAGAAENTTKSSDSTSTQPTSTSNLSKTSKETTSAAISPNAKVNKTNVVDSTFEKISGSLAKNNINKNTALKVLKILSKHDKLR